MEEDEKNWVKDNEPDGTCWKRLRELFAEDFHRNVRFPLLSTDPNDDTEFKNRVVEYFRARVTNSESVGHGVEIQSTSS